VFGDSIPDLTNMRCGARVILSRTLSQATGPGKVLVSD
jgi:hypothetical protein